MGEPVTLYKGGESLVVYGKAQGAQMIERGWGFAPSAAPIDATDSAIKLAEANGIDLSAVSGTGANGRITKSDIEALI